jgi:hypothetical protein
MNGQAQRRAALRLLESLRSAGHGELAGRILKQVGKADTFGDVSSGRVADVLRECHAQIKEINLAARVVKRARTAMRAATERAHDLLADTRDSIQDAAEGAAEIAVREARIREREAAHRERAEAIRAEQMELDAIRALSPRATDHGLEITADDGVPFVIPWVLISESFKMEPQEPRQSFIASDKTEDAKPTTAAFKFIDKTGVAHFEKAGLRIRAGGQSAVMPWRLVKESIQECNRRARIMILDGKYFQYGKIGSLPRHGDEGEFIAECVVS